MDTPWPRGSCFPSRQDTGGGQGWNENDPGVAPATVSTVEPFAELLESSTQASANRRYGNTLDLRDLTRTEFPEKALEDDVAVGLVHDPCSCASRNDRIWLITMSSSTDLAKGVPVSQAALGLSKRAT